MQLILLQVIQIMLYLLTMINGLVKDCQEKDVEEILIVLVDNVNMDYVKD